MGAFGHGGCEVGGSWKGEVVICEMIDPRLNAALVRRMMGLFRLCMSNHWGVWAGVVFVPFWVCAYVASGYRLLLVPGEIYKVLIEDEFDGKKLSYWLMQLGLISLVVRLNFGGRVEMTVFLLVRPMDEVENEWGVETERNDRFLMVRFVFVLLFSGVGSWRMDVSDGNDKGIDRLQS